MAKRSKTRSERFKSMFIIALSFVFSLLFTIFVLISGFEQIFFIDVKYFSTLRPFERSAVIKQLEDKFVYEINEKSVNKQFNDDRLRFISIPTENAQIELTDSLQRDEQFYVRGNKAHILQKDNSNNKLIYFDLTWRTTNDLDTLSKGSYIYITSESFNYTFIINEIVTSTETLNIPNEEFSTPHIAIVSDANEIYIADLINSTLR